MILKRFDNIIAFKMGQTDQDIDLSSDSQSDSGVISPNTIFAFHSENLEIAEVSPEIFSEMSEINTRQSIVPKTILNHRLDSANALNAWNQFKNPDVLSGKINFGIKSLTLNITQICNLKCTYCAAGGDGTYGEAINKISVEKTLPQLKFFIQNLKANSEFNLSFVGGEPLLYPEALGLIYDYVISQTKEKNIQCKFVLTTNATLINESVLKILSKMRLHITVSLDGDSEINDHVRPSKNGSGSTELTLKGLEKLIHLKKQLSSQLNTQLEHSNELNRPSILSIGIAAVYSSENINLTKSYLFFKTLGVDWYEFNFSYLEKSQSTQNEYIRQMFEIAQIAWNEGQEIELRKIKTLSLYFDLFDNQQRIENFCGAGKSYLMIDAKNRLYTCPWEVGNSDEIVGKGDQLDFVKLDKYQKPLIELNNCNNCWAKYVCGGGCMFIHKTHTQDKHKKDELFCERTRSLILIAIMYYKKSRAS